MTDNTRLLLLTSEIVANYVAGNRVPAAEIPSLIRTIFATLRDPDGTAAVVEEEARKATPAQIRKSMSADALVSFEDGRPYKSLKRHLTTRGITPAEYRAKWGLPSTYPMVAPSYSAARSEMAKRIGLGSGGRGKKAAPPAPVKPSGRPKKQN
jgi:predicted transcriptional regulator